MGSTHAPKPAPSLNQNFWFPEAFRRHHHTVTVTVTASSSISSTSKISRAAEFVVYKLKEMGKISQEDISLLMQEFEELDVDQSGTLSISDLALAQSS
ncbi:hypothetical protein HN51_023656 [Arachis hypogaea]|uniref:EF-hand domain-containing protein n=1 Tax=Arachis hypogaea TaxID=3818 RepID=A0A445C321_ARAHY|nr:two pore potassium channel a [Arachis hypogaea]QHO26560.1 Two pore potassium channel a [Arachis hypogaea]RYR45322.1 hypothetical protein Ahy_A07g031164 [Arachis hypogaea]